MDPGYIGGDAFHALYERHPDYDYTLLVRNEERGKLVAEKYPKVRFVYGDLNSTDVFEKEAAAADVVVHTADSADSMPSALAIGKGLAAGHSAEKPGYYIHLCGTGILMDTARWGEPPLPENAYHDIDGIERILSLPDTAYHRDVDKVVLAANTADGSVRTLIRAGVPHGGDHAQDGLRTHLWHGETEWDCVHVRDLSQFFVLAVEAALDPARGANPEVFGPRAYYFLESGKLVAGELARWIMDEVNGQDLLEKPAELKTFEKKTRATPAWRAIHTAWRPGLRSILAGSRKPTVSERRYRRLSGVRLRG
ncbi:uncharacterized protein PG998_011265 [Apiospora kogelbergensis]|uniref:uncharacterized protein n=1 Tax=Apiospora kogelbergensis TaxID=1337665 RepID=UPI00312D04A6